LALQYYIAGRSACFAYSMPVAGNLLHHAVEMALKHLLAEKGFTDSELHYEFRHDLKKEGHEEQSLLETRASRFSWGLRSGSLLTRH